MLLLFTWIATLIASSAVQYIASDVLHVDAAVWLGIAQFVGLVVLFGLALANAEMRPLVTYLLGLMAYVVGNVVVELAKRSDPISSWTASTSEPNALLSEAMLRFIPALLMLAVVVLRGLGPRQLFLAVGDFRSEAAMPFAERVSWLTAAPIVTILIALPLLGPFVAAVRSAAPSTQEILGMLPPALVFAVVNAAQEEVRFRVVPLAALEPVVGSGHALLVSSVLFGSGHYRGHPSGALGVVGGALVGWLWGRALLDTRGLAVPWMSHGVQDLIIYLTSALARR